MNKILSMIALFIGVNAHAEKMDVSGSLGVETRVYFQNPLQESQPDDFAMSLFFEPEMKWRSDDRSKRFSFVGFLRADNQDHKRTHADIRELYFAFNHQDWTTTLGINKIFWGVTESVHLVDVINQTDFVEDIDGEDKLGQAMVHFSTQKDWGKLDLFLLPYFRERTFPGVEGRFNSGLNVSNQAVYQSSDEENHLDWALRYSHYIGDMDLGISFFDGTNREPVLIPSEDFQYLTPYYEQMTQFGLDVQYTFDAWLIKLEALYRDTDNDSFFAAVGGFEYTFFQVHDAADLGLLLEYQHDERGSSSPFTLADNDVFIAARYALNDTEDTSILAGWVVDTETDSQFFNIEAERRIGDNLKANLRVRSFTEVSIEDALYPFRNDDYAQLSLSWYF